MSQNCTVPLAVQRALAMSAAVAGGVAILPAQVQAQEQTGAGAQGPVELQEVVITGTRVRRVDTETANPVFVIDQSTIAQTGANTVGDLVTRIPEIAGLATNPQINNGGGFGETNIELRGLGVTRTLILIDGQRVNLAGASNAVDVNNIPLNLIERVEVLKQGAGATYGSDAIAGVVNFITRKDTDGVELTGDWGQSTHHDTGHHDFGLLFGSHNDKFHMQAGAYYNQQDELVMGARDWSKLALYLYSGSLFPAGSSRTPTGRITTPPALHGAGPGQFNCGTITRIAGTDGTSTADYRCFNAGGPADDHFNFQPYNLDVTPQERGALFTKLNYDINDLATAYTSVIYNHTHSGFQLAPLPFDANSEQIVISKNSIYNPFGVDFGGGAAVNGANGNFLLRLVGIGDRASDTATSALITRTGVKGKIGPTGWQYDASVSYNRLDQDATVHGYFFSNQMQAAVGPSFYAGPGNTNPTCGTPAAPIPNCTPVNIFDLTDLPPSAVTNFSAYYSITNTFVSKTANLDFNGPVFKLPGGDALGAVGVDYTGLTGSFQTSAITQLQAPTFLKCDISQEACSGNNYGKYNFKEGYLELFLPVLANLPGVKSLNLDAGVRYTQYSLFGSTTRSSFKLEYRPFSDLMARGTYSQVFRAPTISDISASPAANAPTLNDICNGYHGVATAAYPFLPSACVGVPTDGSFHEPQNQITGLVTSNPNLKPETGNVETFGFVYDPSYAAGLSFTADYFNYTVNQLITTLDPNYALQQCGLTGSAEFCSLEHRYPVTSGSAGQFNYFLQPTFNIGTQKTDGVDLSLRYLIKGTRIGDFSLFADETHLMSFTDEASPGATPEQIAGQYSKQFGFYGKDRGTLSLGWGGFGAQAMLSMRYISGVSIPLTNCCDANGNFIGWHMASVKYYDLTAGYKLKWTNTDMHFGILNLTNKLPPVAGINSFGVGSAITDVTTYDTIGRRFYIGLTQKF